MLNTGSMYSIHDINDFLTTLNVNDSKIVSTIYDGSKNLQCLKIALEIYSLRIESKSKDKLGFSSKTVVKLLSTENITTVCDVLRLASKVQTDEHFYDTVHYVKSINIENKQDIFDYLELLSTLIRIDNTYEVLDKKFIISIYKIILARNLNKEKSYFITDVLKPYFANNPLARSAIINELFVTFDLYTVSCIISEIPAEECNSFSWIHIKEIIMNKNSQWDYKLALNILKTFINHIDINNFSAISTIIKGQTKSIVEFQNTWQNFFILLETAEEKQLHLVQPSLVLLKKIEMLNFMWIYCIYRKLLNHMQLSVVYSTGIAILDNACYNIDHYEEFVQHLLSGINKNDYSEYATAFYKKLEFYVNEIEMCYYEILLQESAKINWTPLTAWLFYSHCVARLCDIRSDSIKCKYIRQILHNLKKLPHKYIRYGCFNLFYNSVAFDQSIMCEKLKMLDEFKSYNHNNAEAYYTKDTKKIISANEDDCASCNFKIKFKNSKYDVFTRNEHVQNLVEIIVNPHRYDDSEVSMAYRAYNTYQDELHSKNILDVWTKKILTERISSDICVNYITHLCFYLSQISDHAISEKIEIIINNVFGTQHEDVFKLIYENLMTFLKPLSMKRVTLDRIMFDCYRQLKNCKGSVIWEKCLNFYFKTFFIYYGDGFNTGSDTFWSTVFEEVIQDEVTAYIWLSNLPKHLETLFLPYLLRLIYIGDCYTKQKRYEDAICYQIFLAGGPLTGEVESSLITKVRLKALQVCKNLNGTISEVWDTLFNIPHKRYFPDSTDHICCIRSVQTILVLIQDTQFHHEDLFDKILWHLCEANHQPSVRQIMQWIVIKLSLANPKYFDILIETFKISKSISALTAIILILYHVSLGISDDFIGRAIDVMLQYTTGAIFKLRVYSQVAIFKLIDKQKRGDKKYAILHKLLKKTIEENEESINKVLRTDRELFEAFDPEKNYHLRTIFVDIPKMNNVASAEWQYIEFNLDKYSEYENILPMDKNKQRLITLMHNENKVEKKNFESPTTNMQKKVVPLHTFDMASIKATCTDLIVIASLVTSSANLGGLARTCEIYGVKKLVLHDGKIVNDKEFKSLSMSSEYWLNIVEVKVDNLTEYIVEEKNNGYTVLGVEQTCESIKLNDYKFPEKCILVLGNEREGISPHFLPYLDVCVEIPQFGVVRSLNVHVAGSTFIWEYVRQRIK